MLNSLSNYGKVTVEAIYLIPCKPMKNYYVRPYTSGINDINRMNMFTECVDDYVNDGNTRFNIGGETVAKEDLFSSVVNLKAMPSKKALIPNGWDIERYKFFMVVTYIPTSGLTKTTYMLQGYTSHAGISRGAGGNYHVDPNMYFFVNSILEFEQARNGVGQFVLAGTKVKSYNILSDVQKTYETKTGVGGLGPSVDDVKLSTIRPTDIHNSLYNKSMQDQEEFEQSILIDGTSTLRPGTQKSSVRANTDSFTYVDNIISSYRLGKKEALAAGGVLDSIGQTDESYFRVASDQCDVKEANLSKNMFLDKINAAQAIHGNSTMFSVTELSLAFEGLFSPLSFGSTIILCGSSLDLGNRGNGLNIYDSGYIHNSENNTSSRLEYIHALELISSVIGVATSMGITQAHVALVCTNATCYSLEVIECNTIIRQHLTEAQMEEIRLVFQNRITRTCANKYCKNYDFAQVLIYINLFEDSFCTVKFSFDGMGDELIVHVPSYADSLFNPCLGTVTDRNVLTNDLYQIFDVESMQGLSSLANKKTSIFENTSTGNVNSGGDGKMVGDLKLLW